MDWTLNGLIGDMRVERADGGTTNLRELVKDDKWQRDDLEAVLASLAGGRGTCKRHWWERGRGHSKTTDAAIIAIMSLALSRRQLSVVVAAGDQDQATLLRNAIQRIVRLNAGLDAKQTYVINNERRRGILDVQQTRVVHTETLSVLDVISSDEATSWGLLPDLVILDELTNWPDKGERLFHSLFSAAGKRPGCALLIITNAGYCSTWQHRLRERVRVDPAWRFSRLEGPIASWIDPETLAEQQRLLPPSVYGRVWLNEWQVSGGDALNPDLIDRSVIHAGPMLSCSQGYRFIGGLDLGIKRDASALVIIARHVGHVEYKEPVRKPRSGAMAAMLDLGLIEPSTREPDTEAIFHAPTGVYRLALSKRWKPTKGGQVNLAEVEEAIIAAHRMFRLSAIGCDPWQAHSTIQSLTRKGIPAIAVDPVPSSLKAQAGAVANSFSDGLVELYNDPDLINDLKALRIVEKAYGVRLESPRNADGHGDSATAFSIAMALAQRYYGRARHVEGELITWPAMAEST